MKSNCLIKLKSSTCASIGKKKYFDVMSNINRNACGHPYEEMLKVIDGRVMLDATEDKFRF